MKLLKTACTKPGAKSQKCGEGGVTTSLKKFSPSPGWQQLARALAQGIDEKWSTAWMAEEEEIRNNGGGR